MILRVLTAAPASGDCPALRPENRTIIMITAEATYFTMGSLKEN
jgi:hypothetical protein